MSVTTFKSNVAAAGTANTHSFSTAFDGLGAKNLTVTNTHATGVLEITVSENGTDYTASESDVNPGDTVNLRDANLAAVKIDADTSGTTYTVMGWR